MIKIFLILLAVAATLGIVWIVFYGKPVHAPEVLAPDVLPGMQATSTVDGSPRAASNQKSTASLDLSGQGLTKAPAYIFSRTDLAELNLSHNKIDGALQAEIRTLQNLTVLDLSNNMFTGVPAEVGQLKKLEILNLSNNKLTGLPNELGNLKSLKVLDLSGNAYSEADLLIIKKGLPSTTVIKTR